MDIRKLQILNDRINYTIDALNQCRNSIYGQGFGTPYLDGGLSHSTPTTSFGPAQGYGYVPSTVSYGYPQTFSYGYPQTVGYGYGYAQPGVGLSHSTPVQWFTPQVTPSQAFAPVFGPRF